jgi:hypothetical protein
MVRIQMCYRNTKPFALITHVVTRHSETTVVLLKACWWNSGARRYVTVRAVLGAWMRRNETPMSVWLSTIISRLITSVRVSGVAIGRALVHPLLNNACPLTFLDISLSVCFLFTVGSIVMLLLMLPPMLYAHISVTDIPTFSFYQNNELISIILWGVIFPTNFQYRARHFLLDLSILTG